MSWRQSLHRLWCFLSAAWVLLMVGLFCWLLILNAQWHLALMAVVACAIIPPLIVYGVGWMLASIIDPCSRR
jgi:hypothetical protein